MIYVDEMQNYGNSGWWCHMWSDTLDVIELHELAASIDLKLEWFQISHGAIITDFPHYDLRASKRKAALKKGAVAMSLSTWMRARMRLN